MDRWQYTGTGTARSYGDYVDADTGRQLLAEPGGEYAIRTTFAVLPVPPNDGNWKPASGNKTVGDGGQAAGGSVSDGEIPAKAAPSGKAKATPAGAAPAA